MSATLGQSELARRRVAALAVLGPFRRTGWPSDCLAA